MKARNVFLLVALATFAVAECKKKPLPVVKKRAPDFTTEGWLDDDTFQVKAIGKPYRSAKGFGRRRRQAQRSARLLAEKRVVKLMAQKLGSASLASSLSEKFGSTIEGGKVVKRNFNIDDECSVVYRVSQKGLKAKVSAVAKN